MDVIPSDLSRAAHAAGDRLSHYANDVAVAPGSAGRPAPQSAMAGAARAAIFADALLFALHARLEEIKSVAK